MQWLIDLIIYLFQDEIKNALEGACALLPSEYKDICDSIVEDYISEIIEKLLKNIDPYEICKEIGLCKANKFQALQPSLTGILSPVDTLPLQEARKGTVKSE